MRLINRPRAGRSSHQLGLAACYRLGHSVRCGGSSLLPRATPSCLSSLRTRVVLSHPTHQSAAIATAADLSLTGTPVLDCPLSASASPMDLAHSISSLSLAGDDSVHAAAAAAAAAAVAALGVASPQPQLAAAGSPLLGQAGAGSPGWGLCGGLQVGTSGLPAGLAVRAACC